MSERTNDRKPWPATNEEAAELIRQLKSPLPEPGNAEPGTAVNLTDLFAGLRTRIAESEWWAVTGPNGINPLVPLIRDVRDSTSVTVLIPKRHGEPGAAESLTGRLSLTRVRPAQLGEASSSPSVRSDIPPLVTCSAADEDEDSDDGTPLVDPDEVETSAGKSNELEFTLELSGLTETTRVLHAEIAELTDHSLASADLIGLSTEKRRAVINTQQSAVMTTRRAGVTCLQITTTSEELNDLDTQETAAFGLVCVQEGGDANV